MNITVGGSSLSRRGFVRLASGGALLGVALPLLNACGGIRVPSSSSNAAATSPAAGQSAAGPYPSYIPNPNKPKPDFPARGPLYDDGYINYPANPTPSITEAPGTGSNVIAFLNSTQPPPAPYDQNAAWQEVNKRLNANFQFNIVSQADYQAKIGALMAGSDLPDVIAAMPGITGVPNLAAFLRAQCADLTPYLGGDAVKDYPNLAAIPTFAWKNSGCAYNGKLYMWPVERYRPLNMLFRNTGIWDTELGANYTPTNADDFKRALQQLNRPNENRYAVEGVNIQYNLQVFPAMFGAPNGWALDSQGKLTKDIEAPQYKEAVGYVRDLIASGLYHPDFVQNLANATSTGATQTFAGGHAAVIVYTFGVNWSTLWNTAHAAQPPVDFLPLGLFPAHDGGKLGHFLGPGFIATNGMKQASPERIKELLRIVDWLAAPFGSAEDLLLTYGLKDVEYTLDSNGHPVQMQGKAADTQAVPWQYVVQHPQVMFFPNYPDYARLEADAEKMLIPVGIEDPTWGLFAPSMGSVGPTVGQLVLDTLTDILVGRRELSEYDQMVKDWQSKGGNQMRGELEAGLSS